MGVVFNILKGLAEIGSMKGAHLQRIHAIQIDGFKNIIFMRRTTSFECFIGFARHELNY